MYCTVHCLFVHVLTHTHVLMLLSKIQVHFVVPEFIAFAYKP